VPCLQATAALTGREKLKLIVNKPSDDKTAPKDLSEDFINIASELATQPFYTGF
jgi:hypothetical protein